MKKLLIIPILFFSSFANAQRIDSLLGIKGKIIIDTPTTIVGNYLFTPTTTSLTFDSSKVVTDITKNATSDSFQFRSGAGTIIKTLKDSIGISASGTVTLTNKRWIPRVGSATSSATPTINTDNVDIYKLTAQAANITSFTTNLTGSPNDGEILEVQITGTGSFTLAWGSSFVSSTITLPTSITTATLTIILQYYTTSSYGNNKWVCANFY